MNKIILIFQKPIFYLFLILVFGFWVRLYKIENPIADWHSWRQADTAAVARNFFKEGFNPFFPKYDDMSGVASFPIPNPQRYRFVEFPIYPSFVYFTYLLNGGVDERLARIVNILFSLGSTVFIYFLTKRYFSTLCGLLSAFIFAALPFNIYFSRVILPEPSLVFFSLGMVYFMDKWILENKLWQGILSVFFTVCALLTKPYAAFYMLPLLYSYYKKEKRIWPIPIRFLVWGFVSITPFILWRIWINQHPEGIPASAWLLNGNGIRFKPVFFKWILQDRFGREILSVCGTILFFIGAIFLPKVKEGYFMHLMLLSALIFLAVFATGNVQHDYYQTFIIPPLAIFTARGFLLLFERNGLILQRLFTIPVAIIFFLMMFYLTWGEVAGLYQINNPSIVDAGRVADKLIPENANVVAPYSGDTSFLYQTNRHGWAVVAYPVKDLIDMFGVKYFVSVAKDAKTKWVMRKYKVLAETEEYVIVDLTIENPEYDILTDPEPQ